MTKPIGFLILLAVLAGCTSMEGTKSLAGQTDKCHGKPWSWCVGYHGNNR